MADFVISKNFVTLGTVDVNNDSVSAFRVRNAAATIETLKVDTVNNDVEINSDAPLRFGLDLELRRDNPDILAQRRGTNPQNLRIYNTFTDANNYERLEIGFSAGRFGVEATFAGTGTDKGLRLTGRDILFETNTVLRWQIDVGGSLLSISGGNIGSLLAFRPASIFVTTSVVTGLNNFASIDALILDSPALIGDGTRASHNILLTGKGFESATPHDVDWRMRVNVSANVGTSQLFFTSRIDAGGEAVRFQIDDNGDIHIGGDIDHNGSAIGFFNIAPVARASAYTLTNVSADKAFDADTVAIAELADVVGTLINDLIAYGLLDAGGA